MQDCPNHIIDRTIAALKKCRNQRPDGTPINGWQGCEGARAVNYVADVFEALQDGIVQLAEATAYQGPALSQSDKDDLRDCLKEVIGEALYDTVQFNADVDPDDTRADWLYDSKDAA